MSNLTMQWQDLITDLTTQRDKILNDIRNYPPPIPACDAQFNYLLEKRDRLTVELYRLQQLEHNLTGDTIADFVRQAEFISPDLREQLRPMLLK